MSSTSSNTRIKTKVIPLTEGEVKKAAKGAEPFIMPITEAKDAPYCVFAIHGLKSGVTTWGPIDGKEFRWLNELSKWLQKRPGGEAAEINLVGWNTQPLSTANLSRTIAETARPLTQKILNLRTGVGKGGGYRQSQKTIIIGHSMGGILARAMLGFMHSEIAQGRGKGANDIEAFLRSIEGVILLASPSNGSKLAVYASKALKMAASTSGSNSVLFNPAHVESLMPNDPELKQITTNFDKYCVWYKDKQGRPLKVAAFRETKGMFKVPRLGFTKVKVVDYRSGDIPESTKQLVDGETTNLTGRNHLEATAFSDMEDVQLAKILNVFLRMQQDQPLNGNAVAAPADSDDEADEDA